MYWLIFVYGDLIFSHVIGLFWLK
ncbi:hypothetical protein F383_34407 [Gossypium arboreum]|uniref:Uncharacterized protein n=1 Tax=Gossypium arboreum TaxID=29729 RepID=A0A0B0N916_GOSAR|nr:hypothetical protein F383_34407 [Gossypium arboreum]